MMMAVKYRMNEDAERLAVIHGQVGAVFPGDLHHTAHNTRSVQVRRTDGYDIVKLT